MAKILTQAGGDAAVAVLNDHDRALLDDAVKAYTSANQSSVSSLAKTIGVGRTYFYNLLKGNRIELSRLEQVQQVLDVNILDDSQIDAFVRLQASKLSGRPADFHWTSQCIPVSVDKFYLKNFLLPALESESSFWDNLQNITQSKGKYEIDPYEGPKYLLEKLIDYVKHALFGMNPGVLNDVDEDFYSRNSDYITPSIDIPITTNSTLWIDVEDRTGEQIYNDYNDETMHRYLAQYKDQKLDLEFLRGLLDKNVKALEAADRSSEAKGKLEDEHEILVNCIEMECVKSNHERFFKHLRLQLEKIDEWQEKISNYCRIRGRRPRRLSYFPLELEQLAENLDSGTFIRTLVANSLEACQAMTEETRAGIKREALAASKGWKPSMGLEAMENLIKAMDQDAG